MILITKYIELFKQNLQLVPLPFSLVPKHIEILNQFFFWPGLTE